MRVAVAAGGFTPEQFRELLYVVTEIHTNLNQGVYPPALVGAMMRRIEVLRKLGRRMVGDQLYDEIIRLTMTIVEIADL